MFKCPFCVHLLGSPDVQGHLSVNLSKGYFCFRCGAKGGMVSLRDACGGHLEPATAVNSGAFAKVPSPAEIVLVPLDWNIVRGTHARAAAYLRGRGIPLEAYLESGVFLCQHLPGRVVFPMWDRFGVPVFFSARTWQACRRRYRYPAHRDGWWSRNQVLYGPFIQHMATTAVRFKPRSVVLVEGAFDALAVWNAGDPWQRWGVALLGSCLSVLQVRLLKAWRPAEVVVCMDGGTVPTRGVAGILMRQGFKTRVASLPEGEDPASVAGGVLAKALVKAVPVTLASLARARLS